MSTTNLLRFWVVALSIGREHAPPHQHMGIRSRDSEIVAIMSHCCDTFVDYPDAISDLPGCNSASSGFTQLTGKGCMY